MSTEEINNTEEQEEQPVAQDSPTSTFDAIIANEEEQHGTIHLTGMYRNWFLDYASYVILERAVPHVDDGLKPVQRRILHAMRRIEDGRYNKVANIIGYTMQYHPHGDASIQDALVQIGQKNLLIDMQGNWGNIFTGDGAAASRYIEARLTRFALDVVFNPKTTLWKTSYDGRNQEPITLPVKFPLLLAQGAEGIAVGLSSRILPHNFVELLDASIACLRNRSFEIFPDFPTGGLMDVSRYNDGKRGGMVKIRARINILDKRTLCITELPFGKTTSTLIDSILKANEKGKIKIKKIDDNTAENVEILVHLYPDSSPDKTIDALYAFTDCEIPISVNTCVVDNDSPKFLSTTDLLRSSVNNTIKLLTRELEILKHELEEEWHYCSLEKIFIEKKMNREIEPCKTWESVIATIDKLLKPYKRRLKRAISNDDIERLTKIQVRQFTLFDRKKAEQNLNDLEAKITDTAKKLANITQYAIAWYQELKTKYAKGRERKTEIRSFENIEATQVVANNAKLYANRKEGFIGTDLRKDEFIADCSDIDDVIVFLPDGTYMITRIGEKVYVGKDILHVAIFRKNDERTIYNIIFRDGMNGAIMMKRCNITGLIKDKKYNITKGTPSSKILYFTVNPNGESERLKIYLKPRPRLKNLVFELDFGQVLIKNRNSIGNILTEYAIHKIEHIEKGASTLGGEKRWYDETVMRLNTEERGKYLGEFFPDEKIAVFTSDGFYRLTNFDITNHYEENILIIEKFDPRKIYSLIFFDGEQGLYYMKRFRIEHTIIRQSLIGDHPKSALVWLTDIKYPNIEVHLSNKNIKPEKIDVDHVTELKSFKAKGRRLTEHKIKKIIDLNPFNRPARDKVLDATFNLEPENDTPPQLNNDEIKPITAKQMKMF